MKSWKICTDNLNPYKRITNVVKNGKKKKKSTISHWININIRADWPQQNMELGTAKYGASELKDTFKPSIQLKHREWIKIYGKNIAWKTCIPL